MFAPLSARPNPKKQDSHLTELFRMSLNRLLGLAAPWFTFAALAMAGASAAVALPVSVA
jgi:hypothetical protein